MRNLKIGRVLWLALVACACLPLSGCIMVGYSSRGGWFLWPGGLGLIFIVLLLLFLLRRR